VSERDEKQEEEKEEGQFQNEKPVE